MDQTSQTNDEIFEGSDLEALATMRRYHECIISHFQPYLAGDAIEIGAGIGNIASHILPQVSTLKLVEPSENIIGRLREKFTGTDNVTIIQQNFDMLVSDLVAAVGNYRRYTADELSSTLESAKFSIELHSYFDFLGIFPWWILNTLGSAITFNPKLVNVYDLVFVPITRRQDTRINPPVGKNLITVGKRTRA